jgi:hypothetical protein
MIVLGLATLIVVVFAVGSALTTSGGRPTSNASSRPRAVRGSSLMEVPGRRLLGSILQPGTPPANIVSAVTVPQGAVRVSTQNNSGAALQYDEQVVLSVRASQADVLAFYDTELPANKWGVFSAGPAYNDPQAEELLARQAGDDGWYWEIGVVVSPSTFGTGAGAAKGGVAGSTDTTSVTIRLFQVADEE